jgi:two-component system, OmpR family, alkaline phosphatase synthesis response regulator PhoP
MLAAAQCPQLGVRVGMKTILLVDDDQSVRVLYGLVLRRNGYHVLEADSGVVALDIARKHLPDLILSDIIIPGSDGVSLLRQVRDDPDLKYRPFILMSGSPDLVTSYKGLEAADDFLVKPIGLQELLECVKTRFLGDPTYNRSTMREGTSNENGGAFGLESF